MEVLKKKLRILPAQIISLCWLSSYKLSFLSADLMAAMTLAAFTLPQAIAYAGLAGRPCEAGLYAAISASIAYFFWNQPPDDGRTCLGPFRHSIIKGKESAQTDTPAGR